MSNVVAFDPSRRRGRRPRTVQPPTGTPLTTLAESWLIQLADAGKSPYTLKNYGQTLQYFTTWLAGNEHPADSETVQAEHCRAYLKYEMDRTSAATAAARHQHLRTFWRWVIREGERSSDSPMTNVEAPKVPPKVRTFFTDDQLRKLLDTCNGASFADRRDTAILRIFMDVGVRVSGMANMRYHPTDQERTDVFLKDKRLRVRLKGGAEHMLPLGRKALAALDRYIRARSRHDRAEESEWLWLGESGTKVTHMTDSGIRQMVKRRGEQAGIHGAHPHRFRRTFAHDYLEGGGTVDGLMAVAGWKSYRMPQIYAGELAAERARQAHERLSPGDRI